MMSKLFIVFVVIFSLSSCTSGGSGSAAKFFSKIRQETKNNYGLDNGDIIAKFDLAGIETNKNSLSGLNSEDLIKGPENKIFASYYANAINVEKYNNKYLQDFKKTYRHHNFIQSNAYKKEISLANLLYNLDNKYKLLPTQLHNIVAKLAKEKSINKGNNKRTKSSLHDKSFNRKRDYFASLTKLHNETKFVPIFTPINNARITSKFGKRVHPHRKKIIHHNGLDIAGQKESRIYSAADGVILEVSRSKTYGNNIVIIHSKKIKTRYAHLGKLNVREGQKVLLGEAIGVQGSSGTSTGPHLHFEVIINDKTVDPLGFIDHGL